MVTEWRAPRSRRDLARRRSHALASRLRLHGRAPGRHGLRGGRGVYRRHQNRQAARPGASAEGSRRSRTGAR